MAQVQLGKSENLTRETPKEVYSLSYQQGRLDAQLMSLRDTLDRLTDRLESVLFPVGPTKLGSDSLATDNMSPMVRNMHLINDQLEMQIDRITHLIDDITL